jgi:hypothetical protein
MSPPFLIMDVVLQNGGESRVMAIASAHPADRARLSLINDRKNS